MLLEFKRKLDETLRETAALGVETEASFAVGLAASVASTCAGYADVFGAVFSKSRTRLRKTCSERFFATDDVWEGDVEGLVLAV